MPGEGLLCAQESGPYPMRARPWGYAGGERRGGERWCYGPVEQDGTKPSNPEGVPTLDPLPDTHHYALGTRLAAGPPSKMILPVKPEVTTDRFSEGYSEAPPIGQET